MLSSSVVTDDHDSQINQINNNNQKNTEEYSPQQLLGTTNQIGVASIS